MDGFLSQPRRCREARRVPAKVQLSDGEMDAAFDAKVAQVRSRDRVMVSYPTADWIEKRKQARDQGKLYVTCVIHPGFPSRSQQQGHQQGRVVLQIGGGDVYFPKDGSSPTVPLDGTMIDLGPIPGKITDFIKDKTALAGMRKKAQAELAKHSKKGWEDLVMKEQVKAHEIQGASIRPEEVGGLLNGILKNKNAKSLAEIRRILAEHDTSLGSQNTGAVP